MGNRSERNISSLALPSSVMNSASKDKVKILMIKGLVAILNPKNDSKYDGVLGFIMC